MRPWSEFTSGQSAWRLPPAELTHAERPHPREQTQDAYGGDAASVEGTCLAYSCEELAHSAQEVYGRSVRCIYSVASIEALVGEHDCTRDIIVVDKFRISDPG